MQRLETNLVMKYCPAVDEFVSVRMYSDDELAGLLENNPLSGKRDYMRLVGTAAILDYNTLLQQIGDRSKETEEELYQLVVSVNPNMEIGRVVIPLHKSATVDEPATPYSDLGTLEAELNNIVIGQTDAVQKLVASRRVALAGLSDPTKPRGTFFFSGPSGVGKTWLAENYAIHTYGEGSYHRVDCSEFSMPHEYAKLIGAPPGYIGHNETSSFMAFMKRRECLGGVALFDEIEKADGTLLNLLLSVLDRARLTDSKRYTADFSSIDVIFTSNVSQGYENRERMGFGAETNKPSGAEILDASLSDAFRTEFIGRLRHKIHFNHLDEDDIHAIVGLEFQKIQDRKDGEVDITFSGSVYDFVAQQGESKKFGARHISDVVYSRIVDPLSDYILSHPTTKKIQVGLKGEKVTFSSRRKRKRVQS